MKNFCFPGLCRFPDIFIQQI